MQLLLKLLKLQSLGIVAAGLPLFSCEIGTTVVQLRWSPCSRWLLVIPYQGSGSVVDTHSSCRHVLRQDEEAALGWLPQARVSPAVFPQDISWHLTPGLQGAHQQMSLVLHKSTLHPNSYIISTPEGARLATCSPQHQSAWITPQCHFLSLGCVAALGRRDEESSVFLLVPRRRSRGPGLKVKHCAATGGHLLNQFCFSPDGQFVAGTSSHEAADSQEPTYETRLVIVNLRSGAVSTQAVPVHEHILQWAADSRSIAVSQHVRAGVNGIKVVIVSFCGGTP